MRKKHYVQSLNCKVYRNARFFTLQCSDVCLYSNSPAVVMTSLHNEGPRKSSLFLEFLKGSRIGCRKSLPESTISW